MDHLNAIDKKSIIVTLPINIHNEIFDPQSFNIKNKKQISSVISSFQKPHKKCSFMVNNCQYEKKITKLTRNKYFSDTNIDDSRSIHCWHCCCEIIDRPVGIPVKSTDKKMIVKGFFCSLSCGLTYNYNSPEFDSTIQERESLIRSLSDVPIQYAPPRESLKLFGGVLSYNEFHSHSHSNGDINIIYEPMIPLISYIEENIPIEANDSELLERRGLQSFFG
jgi:hypothetical protein